jgi:outer membrane protein assembly factor BamA
LRRLAALVLLALAPQLAAADGRVARVTITGKTLEPVDRLARFLGVAPGDQYGSLSSLTERVDDGLDRLAYVARTRSFEETPAGLVVTLDLQPAEVVRHIFVNGNWPVFEEEIRRRLRLRPGARLPPEPERTTLLAAESERLRDYLVRDGWFGAGVKIKVVPAGRPEWKDLVVDVSGVGWRQYVRLGAVEVEGATVLKPDEFLKRFGSSKPYFFGRLRVDRLRDDARDLEKEYRDLGYPAARVLPDPKPEGVVPGGDEARLRVRVTEKARVDLHFEGNKELTDHELRDKVTIFSSGSYDEVELEQSERELQRLYQTTGHLEAQVTHMRKRSAGVEDITFHIVEGPELKVRDVRVVAEPGAPPLEPAEVTRLMGLLTTRPLSRISSIGLGGLGSAGTPRCSSRPTAITSWRGSAPAVTPGRRAAPRWCATRARSVAWACSRPTWPRAWAAPISPCASSSTRG